MNHEELVAETVKYVKMLGHYPVFHEEQQGKGEVPDVVSFHPSGKCYVWEIKVSKGDFLADKGKPWRKFPQAAMGSYRHYVAPKGLIETYEVEEVCWGLYEWDDGLVCREESPPWPSSSLKERDFLLKQVKRLYKESATRAPRGDRRKNYALDHDEGLRVSSAIDALEDNTAIDLVDLALDAGVHRGKLAKDIRKGRWNEQILRTGPIHAPILYTTGQ